MPGLEHDGYGGLDRLELIELKIPLRTGFATSRATISSRTVILVRATRHDQTGWGECAPFPGHSPDSIDASWDSLAGSAPMVIGKPSDRGRRLDDLALTQTAAAALDEAFADVAATEAATPLWRMLGGHRSHVRAGWVAAAGGTVAASVAAVADGVGRGHTAVKVKIVPGSAFACLSAVIREFPGVAVGADANGAFDDGAIRELRDLDALGLAYIEQPFPAGREDATRELADALDTPVALDESVTGRADLKQAIERATADVLVVKAGHTGSIGTAAAIEAIAAAGLVARVGGLVETTIGRHHALALATLTPDSPAADLAAGSPYFSVEPAGPLLRLEAGLAEAADTAGLGVTVDEERLAALTSRRLVFD